MNAANANGAAPNTTPPPQIKGPKILSTDDFICRICDAPTRLLEYLAHVGT